MWGEWDNELIRWVNGWNPFWMPFYKFMSEALDLGWVRVVFALLTIGMLFGTRQTRKTILLTMCAWPLANLITDIFKRTWPYPRPYQIMPEIDLYTGAMASNGTASGHSANTAAIAFVFVWGLRAWGLPWVFIAVFTGLSRIYLGVHYPSQVLLGWTVGLFCGWLVTTTWEAWVRLRTPKAPPAEIPEPS